MLEMVAIPLPTRFFLLWMLCGFVAPAPAAAVEGHDARPAGEPSSGGGDTTSLFDFDIPAQSLESALQRYGGLSRQPALYRAEIVNGQTAAAVHGRYTAEAALRLLLAGTGLMAEKFTTGGGTSAFILKAASASAASPRTAGLGNLAGYPARLQLRVWQALCANPLTVPGEYRSLLRFQVDSQGQVQRPRLIASTGDAGRDAAMLDVLRHVRMESAPPNGMPQPVTMLLLPHDAGFGRRCGQDFIEERPGHE